MINNIGQDSANLRLSLTPLRQKLERFRTDGRGETKETEESSTLDDETRRLVVDVLELLKSSSGSSTIQNSKQSVPDIDVKTRVKLIDQMVYKEPPETETSFQESPSTSSSSSSSTSSSPSSSPGLSPSKRKKRTVRSSSTSRKERVLQLSPSERKDRTILSSSSSPMPKVKQEILEEEKSSRKSSPSRRKGRTALSSSPNRRRRERATLSASPSKHRKERTAPSPSPSRRKKERTALSSSPQDKQEVVEEEKKKTKRRGKKPKGLKLRESDYHVNPSSPKTTGGGDEDQSTFQDPDTSSLGDFHVHKQNYRNTNGHISSNSNSSKSDNSSTNQSNESSSFFSIPLSSSGGPSKLEKKLERKENNSSPKSPLPRRSCAKSTFRKTRATRTVVSAGDDTPCPSERGTRGTMALKDAPSSTSSRSKSPKRTVRRTKSDNNSLRRTSLYSPRPRPRSTAEFPAECSKSTSPPSSLKRSTVGRTKSGASLKTSASASVSASLQKERPIPSSAPPPPLLLGESSHHAPIFLDEESDTDVDSAPIAGDSWHTASSDGSSRNQAGNRYVEEPLKPGSMSSLSCAGSNSSAGGKVRNVRTHEVYTGFFLLSEGSDGRPVNLKHGYGRTKFPDGKVFEGTYDHGIMVEGKMTYPEDPYNTKNERTTYVGKFDREGFRCGKGICTTASTTYLGDFYRDEMHGSGILIYHTNETYSENDYDKSCKEGCRFVGHWKGGMKHGTGKEIGVDGSIQREGIWKKGCFSGAS